LKSTSKRFSGRSNALSASQVLSAPSDARRLVLLILWAMQIGCVIVGELLPAASPVMVAVGRLPINDKVQHFCAYLLLLFLPVIGFHEVTGGFTEARSLRGWAGPAACHN
jgi:hypothetical protein